MAVLDMNPCYLYTSVAGMSYTDANGNRHVGKMTFEKYIRCDVVPAGQATQHDFGDGVVQTYSYTIYIHKKECRDFALGEAVKFEKNGKLSREFLVKGFHRYQHQCKIWI